MSPYSILLEKACDIAERASRIALSYFRQPILIEMKENQTPVTIADKKTEEAIRNELAAAFPGHGILGEEFGREATQSEFLWTVDPIDGTRSFIRGIPLFGTLLGLMHNGEPVVGVMVLPALHEIYTAAKGLGTFCNGVQVRTSNTKVLESSFISVGDTDCFEQAGHQKLLATLTERAEICRGYTDCFGHSLVIRGAVDAMIDPVVNLWDVAPLACLIEEAGGEYCDFQGKKTVENTSFIACAPDLRNEILRLI